jgi:hypothetical protein
VIHLDDAEAPTVFKLSMAYTRSHSLKLFQTGYHLDCKIYASSHKVLDICNSLFEDTIACDLLNSTKTTMDKFLHDSEFI